MWRVRVGRVAIFAIVASSLNLISLPTASAIGTGNCISTVSGATATATQSGNTCIVIFTAGSGTWTIPSGVTSITYLVVGGGGAASRGTCGVTYGPGGGGGGVQSGSLSISGTVNVSVGAGGAVKETGCPNTSGASGSPSTLATVTANGGTGSGVGKTGGTNGNGFQGGTDTVYTTCGECGAGGGGGASAAGSQLNGGAGVTSSITGTSVMYGSGGAGRGGTVFGSASSGGGYAPSNCAATPNQGGGGADCNSSSGGGGSGIVVAVYNFDNTPPTITSATTFSTGENVLTSTSVATIRTSESSTITISGGADSLRFTISFNDSQSANIRFVASPNFEAPADSGGNNIYNLNLLATDRVGLTGSQSITISVTNINEAPVIGALSGGVTATYSVAENSALLYSLSATDEDSGTTLTYSLTGTDASDFTIDSSGQLSFAPAPDFEAPTDNDSNNSYIVITWVSDGTLSDSQTVTITVTDINESGVLTAPSISGTPFKGLPISTTVSVNAPGKVRFFLNGKRVANCLAIPTSGSGSTYTATCTWRPTITGRQSLTATFTPTSNTFSAATSPALSTWVFKRTTKR
jgi:VCBS repeat-containing protein